MITNWVMANERIEELEKHVADLNRLLRDVGWGQGEIDTAAVLSEENEQLRAALRKLVEECKTLEMLVGAEADKLPSAWEAMFNQINDAIAEAERLLNESEAKDE